jgi:FkbM family methyltransferase
MHNKLNRKNSTITKIIILVLICFCWYLLPLSIIEPNKVSNGVASWMTRKGVLGIPQFKPPYIGPAPSFIQLVLNAKSSFLYAINDTLHSAAYIVSEEVSYVEEWMNYLQEAQDLRRKAHPTGELSKPRCLDVGSNGGFYSMVSRSMGCSVLAVDAQPHCLTRVLQAAAANGFDSDFSVWWTAVSDDSKFTVNVGATKCSGVWAITDNEFVNSESDVQATVSSTPLLTIVNEWIHSNDHIDLFKIDVEGSELNVLHSALPLFQAGRIGYCLVEISPHRVNEITPWPVVEKTVNALFDSGYTLYSPSHSSREQILSFFHPNSKEMYRGAPTLYAITKTGHIRDPKYDVRFDAYGLRSKIEAALPKPKPKPKPAPLLQGGESG